MSLVITEDYVWDRSYFSGRCVVLLRDQTSDIWDHSGEGSRRYVIVLGKGIDFNGL
jgi:hypothetical protein